MAVWLEKLDESLSYHSMYIFDVFVICTVGNKTSFECGEKLVF